LLHCKITLNNPSRFIAAIRHFSRKQKAGIALYDGNTLVYSSHSGEGQPDLSVLPNNRARIVLKKNDESLAVWVAGRLPESYNYALFYGSDISSTLNRWYRMKNTMFEAGLIISRKLFTKMIASESYPMRNWIM
jgi:hypothetical protein